MGIFLIVLSSACGVLAGLAALHRAGLQAAMTAFAGTWAVSLLIWLLAPGLADIHRVALSMLAALCIFPFGAGLAAGAFGGWLLSGLRKSA
jgi:hypothetical protein